MHSRFPLVASALVLLATTASAGAADIVEQPIVEAPIFTWTGPYLGIQGGFSWANSRFRDDFDVFESRSNNSSGGLLGGLIGYNWQTGSFVFGAEADINKVWNDRSFDVGRFDVDVEANYLASIRARAGYAWDRALLFATGGVAFTGASADATIDGIDFSASQSFTGWTVGGGVDYAFTDNWIGRLEYRFYDFGNQDVFDTRNMDIQYNTLTVGVAYKW